MLNRYGVVLLIFPSRLVEVLLLLIVDVVKILVPLSLLVSYTPTILVCISHLCPHNSPASECYTLTHLSVKVLDSSCGH